MGEEEYAAYLSQYAQKIASLMESHADTVTYGEEQSVTVHVQPDSDGIYEIPEEDLQAVDALIIPVLSPEGLNDTMLFSSPGGWLPGTAVWIGSFPAASFL